MTDRLAAALDQHRQAAASMIEALRRIPADEWARPLPDGAWSPAQIAEHLILTLEGAAAEANGGPPNRIRTGPAMQRLLRWFLVPHILFHRSFPIRARAPREWRPEGGGLPAAESLERLARAAETFEQAAARAHAQGRRFSHPYFGPLDAVRTIRVSAVHLEHHRKQALRRVSGPPA